MNKFTLSVISSLFLNVNISFATHQEIDIIFSDGIQANYSNRGIKFVVPVTFNGDLEWNKREIVVKGVSIDRSLSMEQIQLKLSSSPLIREAILKVVKDDPDESFFKAIESHYDLFKADLPLNDKIDFYRKQLTIVKKHVSLGSETAKSNLYAALNQMVVNLYKRAEELGEIECIPVLREASEFADASLKTDGSDSIHNKREVVLALGCSLVKCAEKQEIASERLKLMREGLGFLETVEEMKYPNIDKLSSILAWARNLLGETLLNGLNYGDMTQNAQIKEALLEAFNIYKLASQDLANGPEHLDNLLITLFNQGTRTITHAQKQKDTTEKLKFIREGVAFIETAQNMWRPLPQTKQELLGKTLCGLATELIEAIYDLEPKDLALHADTVDILKEADILYKVASYHFSEALEETDTVKIVLEQLGVRILNHASQEEDINKKLRLIRKGINFIETTQEIGHPHPDIINKSLAVARNNLGVALNKYVESSMSSYQKYLLNEPISDLMFFSIDAEFTNFVVDILRNSIEAIKLFKLSSSHYSGALENYKQIVSNLSEFDLVNKLQSLKQLLHDAHSGPNSRIAKMAINHEALDSAINNVDQYIQSVESLAKELFS